MHPERAALITCPRCGSYACLACWHGTFDRCHACLERDPFAAAPPLPWEAPEAGPLRRLFGTLGTALWPSRSAPAFAREAIAPAVRFALLVALPLALLRGVIPFTHTLRFGPTFAVTVIGHPSTRAVAMDVMHAAGISLLFTAVQWLALTLPFVSLAQAYGGKLARPATMRVMLYRAFLVPLSIMGLLQGVCAWGLPADAGAASALALNVIDLLPLLLLVVAMRATARTAGGVGPFASFVVVLLPFILMTVAQALLMQAITPWLPASLTTSLAVGS